MTDAVPPAAIDAAVRSILGHHRTAAPLEAYLWAHDAVTAAAPLIAAAERDRITALIEAEEGKLRAEVQPWADTAATALSDAADLITGSAP